MRHIRRATVTGLFAIWLAPLSAAAEAPNGMGLSNDRGAQFAPVKAESRRTAEDGTAAEDPQDQVD